MDDEIKPEKYRKLSVTSLVTGIIPVCIGGLYNFLWLLIADFLRKHVVDVGLIPYVVLPVLGVALGLAITAVVCGSIDLKRIRAGIYSRKGKGFDITGIVLGGLFILVAICLLLGEILVPH